MSREAHVQFCERLGVRFPGATHLIITGCSKELLENEVKPLVERFMFERGLQLSPEKTCITPIEEGFDFLGQNLRRYGGKLLITPSKKNMHAFLEKVRGQIRSNRATKQEYLIRLLNPVIRGWAYYHRHIEAGSAYRKVGMVLWHSLWRWAKRRHPNKSATWIVDRYWHRLGRRSWCFAVMTGSNAQRSRSAEVRLVNPTEIPPSGVTSRSSRTLTRSTCTGAATSSLERGSGEPVGIPNRCAMCSTGSAHAGLTHGLSRMRETIQSGS